MQQSEAKGQREGAVVTVLSGAIGPEAEAIRLVDLLDVLGAAERPEAWEAQKHRMRLQFALDRARELGEVARAEGGAFAPARAEVARSILEAQVASATGFLNRTVRQGRRSPGRSDTRAASDAAAEAIADESQAA